MKSVVFIDIEVSDLLENDGEIIEVCLITLDDSGAINEFHTYIKPLVELRDISVEITGIQNETLLTAPTFEDSYEQIIEIIKNSQLIGKLISFDVDILNKSFGSIGSTYKVNIADCVDLMDIEKQLGLKEHSNEYVAEKLNIELASNDDCKVGASLYKDIYLHYLNVNNNQEQI